LLSNFAGQRGQGTKGIHLGRDLKKKLGTHPEFKKTNQKKKRKFLLENIKEGLGEKKKSEQAHAPKQKILSGRIF